MVVGDMVFVRDSLFISTAKPLIIIDIYKVGLSSYPYFVVVDPNTGEKFTYQEHNLSLSPGIPL
jgi:Ni,Fe-hydrogenase maturation factor